MEYVVLIFGVVFVVVIGIVINPYFLQGYRNSKFIDELLKEDEDKDNEEIIK